MRTELLAPSDRWIANELNAIASNGFENVTQDEKTRAISLLEILRTNQNGDPEPTDEEFALDVNRDESDYALQGSCIFDLRDGYVFAQPHD